MNNSTKTTLALSLLQGGNVLLTFKSNCSCDAHLQLPLPYFTIHTLLHVVGQVPVDEG